MINFENLDKFKFPGVGKYGIPQIEPVKSYPQGEFIPVNYHYTAKDTKNKIVHFFDWEYRAKWYGEDEATAKAMLPRAQDMVTEQQQEVE
nr:MAG TPA: protein of unknown function DUF4417 [Caudoviricetes sp.]